MSQQEEDLKVLADILGPEKIREAIQITGREGFESGAKFIMAALEDWMDTVRYGGESPTDEIKRLFTKTRLDRGDVEIVGGSGMAYRSMAKTALTDTIIDEKRVRGDDKGYNTDDGITMETPYSHPMGPWEFIPTNDLIPCLKTRQEIDDMVEELLAEHPLLVEQFITGFSLASISLDGGSRAEMKEILGPWPKPEYLDRELSQGDDKGSRIREEMK